MDAMVIPSGAYMATPFSTITLSGMIQMPLRVEPCRRMEYPHQTTLAVPGLVMPFIAPGYAPTLMPTLLAESPAVCQLDRPSSEECYAA
jgi:hypothetical protein